MKVGAVIPCRTGSKGIPNKNFKDFCGKPLWQWTYEAARASGVFDFIIVSSDKQFSGPIESLPPKIFYDFNRPPELADDKADLDTLMSYYTQMYPDIDIWCLLQPTSPLRTADDIKAAYAMMLEMDSEGKDYKYDSLVSVYQHPVLAWVANSVGIPGVEEPQAIATYRINKRPNRQDRGDWFLENGAIYFTRKYVIEHVKCRLHGFIGLYVMPKERSVEIDDPFDWKLCEMLMGDN